MSQPPQYRSVLASLRQAYDGVVQERDNSQPASWKVEQRQAFLQRVQAAGLRSLLDIGAGTGVHAEFFQHSGMDVTCTDLSPAMVECCRRKGLQAHVMDFLALDFPSSSFDAVFAMNCLLHVPKRDFQDVLRLLERVLRPGGLLFIVQYGGKDIEAVHEHDRYQPKRFFSFFTDDALLLACSGIFEPLDFTRLELEDEKDLHVQALTLRKQVQQETANDV